MVRLGKYFTPFLMLCLVGLSARLGYQLARAPVLPRFADELSAQTWLIGLIVGASTITGVFIKFPAGAISDVLGRRKMLIAGAAFFAFPPFLYVLVDNAGSLLALRFVHGMATAIFSPVASAAVADLYKSGRGERLGWFASANELGSSFGPLLGGALLAAQLGSGLDQFRYLYLVVGALGVLTLLLVILLPVGGVIPAVTGAARPTYGRLKQLRQGMAEVISDRQILITSSVEAAMFVAVGALLGFLPLYAKNVLSLSDIYLGLLIWVPLVMAMAGKPIAGRISDKVGRKSVILMGLAFCILVLPLIPLTTNTILLLVEGTVFGIGMAIVTPSTTAFVSDLCKTGNYGAALGVFGTIWDMGEASGPILAGILIGIFGGLQDESSYALTFVIIAALLAIIGLGFAVSVKEPQRT